MKTVTGICLALSLADDASATLPLCLQREIISAVSTKQEMRLERRIRKRQAKEEQRRKRQQKQMDQATYEITEARPQRNAAPLQAKTEGQLKLIRAIKESDQVIVTGPAGTGKSFIPAAMAADYLAQGHIEKIVLIRPMVSVGRTMGFLPGTQDEKLAPWMIPLTEPLQERLGQGILRVLHQDRQDRDGPTGKYARAYLPRCDGDPG